MGRVLSLVLGSAVALAAQNDRSATTASRFLSHVKWLAADELAGRGNGLDGLERAGAYVREQFRAAGLTGAIGGDFDQPFDAEVRIDPPADTTLVVTAGDTAHVLALGGDFYPLSLLERAPDVAPPVFDDVPLVFAGYGISAPGLGYDDFESIDVSGAAVLVLTHEPQEHDARSVFGGRELTPAASVDRKAREARERGARLLLVVEDPAHASDRATRPAWGSDPQADAMGVPVLRVARQRLADAIPDLDLEAAAAAIDRTLRPQSRPVAARLDYVEHRARFTARIRNIVGLLAGKDPTLGRQAVVIAAHYDHVGTGGALSAAREATGEVHNGADDNASGVAALIEMARAAGRNRARYRRTLVFAAFAGEELGLRGSEHYVQAAPIPLAETRAMINLDMVGRARGRVLLGAFGPGVAWVSPARLRPWTRLAVHDFSRGGYPDDASDVAPFARRGVPAFAFFTGFHSDYHRPTDDWPAIDAEGGAAIADLALRLAEELAR